MKEMRPAAVALKLKLEEIETPFDAKGLESFFKTAKQKQVGAIMTGPGPIYFTERKRSSSLPQIPLPLFTARRLFVGVSYTRIDNADTSARGPYVDKI